MAGFKNNGIPGFTKRLAAFARSNSTGIIRNSSGDRGGVYMNRGRIGGDSSWHEGMIRRAAQGGMLRGVKNARDFTKKR